MLLYDVLYYVTNNYTKMFLILTSDRFKQNFPITISPQELKKTNWRHIN